MSGADIHIGMPIDGYHFPSEEYITFHFHDFENLSTPKGEFIWSPTFSLAGHEWRMQLFPRGSRTATEGMVSVQLWNKSPKRIILSRADIALMKSNGDEYKTETRKDVYFDPLDGIAAGRIIWDFVTRNEILDETNDILNNGTLTIRVLMRSSKNCYCSTVRPQSILVQNISKLFGNRETADVAFNVSDQIHYAHRLILQAQVPELFELAEQFDIDNPMPIKDVESEVFAIMLSYVYGEIIHAHVWEEYSKAILEASGKYGFSVLRSEAEVWCAKHLTLTVDRAIDELMYADGNFCLALKKAVMNFIVENGQAVLASPSYDKLAESPKLVKELLMELAKSNEGRKRKLDELSH